MQDSFDAYRYIEFLRTRWRFIALVCGVAIVLTLAVSLLLPQRFTATASIMIEAPATNDSRTGAAVVIQSPTTALTPIYLESLKGYEQFASSDSLFVRAIERFHLQQNGSPSVESLKRSVLKVAKLRDTKVLQISATLPDPKQAHEFAQFLAEETVKLSHDVARDADQQLAGEGEKQLEAARSKLGETRGDWERFATSEPVESLQADVDAAIELKSAVEKQLLEAKASEAEYSARQKTLASSNGADAVNERGFVERELNGVRARATLLESQLKNLEQGIARKAALLAQRSSRKDQLQTQLKAAQAAYDVASSRLRDLRAMSGFRGESLQIIDPGIVPQRPSSPNIPLNLLAALLAALVIAVVYLSVLFGYNTKKGESLRTTYRTSARADD